MGSPRGYLDEFAYGGGLCEYMLCFTSPILCLSQILSFCRLHILLHLINPYTYTTQDEVRGFPEHSADGCDGMLSFGCRGPPGDGGGTLGAIFSCVYSFLPCVFFLPYANSIISIYAVGLYSPLHTSLLGTRSRSREVRRLRQLCLFFSSSLPLR